MTLKLYNNIVSNQTGKSHTTSNPTLHWNRSTHWSLQLHKTHKHSDQLNSVAHAQSVLLLLLLLPLLLLLLVLQL
jgi:hypothetical protein